jgi:hypothetical protein
MSIAETQAIQMAVTLVDPPLMAVSPVVKLFVVVYHFALGRTLIKFNPCHKDDLPGCEWPSWAAMVQDRIPASGSEGNPRSAVAFEKWRITSSG